MNIPLDLRCKSCGQPPTTALKLGEKHFHWTCVPCGETYEVYLHLDINIGQQVWIRARHELTQTHDFSMAAVLAAMAVDCDLSYLYKKWTGIQQTGTGREDFSDEQYAETLRKVGGIKDKLRTVSGLLVPGGLETFVNSTPKWRDSVGEFPTLDRAALVSSIDQQLFWPRNRILHGDGVIGEEEAKRCVQVARLCLEIFLAMDYEKRKTLA